MRETRNAMTLTGRRRIRFAAGCDVVVDEHQVLDVLGIRRGLDRRWRRGGFGVGVGGRHGFGIGTRVGGLQRYRPGLRLVTIVRVIAAIAANAAIAVVGGTGGTGVVAAEGRRHAPGPRTDPTGHHDGQSPDDDEPEEGRRGEGHCHVQLG